MLLLGLIDASNVSEPACSLISLQSCSIPEVTALFTAAVMVGESRAATDSVILAHCSSVVFRDRWAVWAAWEAGSVRDPLAILDSWWPVKKDNDPRLVRGWDHPKLGIARRHTRWLIAD